MTSLRYGEITQQISRLDSNAETQKKWVGQRLELVEEHARTADERMSGFQSQIDSVRQQTQDLHQSLLAVHDHSQQLTSGLSTVIDKFKNLRFDLPAILDDWSRMNNENREGRVVTTDQLHIPGMPHVPSLPRLSRSLEPLQPLLLPIRQPTPPLQSQSSSDPDSPSKFIARYILSQPATETEALQDIGREYDLSQGAAFIDYDPYRGGPSQIPTKVAYGFVTGIGAQEETYTKEYEKAEAAEEKAEEKAEETMEEKAEEKAEETAEEKAEQRKWQRKWQQKNSYWQEQQQNKIQGERRTAEQSRNLKEGRICLPFKRKVSPVVIHLPLSYPLVVPR